MAPLLPSLGDGRTKRCRATVLAVFVVATLLSPVAALGADVTGPPHRFRDLAGAVDGRALDPSIRAALDKSAPQSEGDVTNDADSDDGVTALMYIDHAVAKQRAIQDVGSAASSAAGIAYSRIRDRMAQTKQLVRSRVPDMRVIDDYESIGAMLVRFRSADDVLTALDTPGITVRANAVRRPYLAQSLPYINQPASAGAGATGAGTYVAVLDTGVDYGRAAFGSCPAPGPSCRVAVSIDTATDDFQRDSIGHGTNVSGIVANVAPATKLLVFDIFTVIDGDTVSLLSDELAAINWVIAAKQAGTYDIKAINMSFGEGNYESPCEDFERVTDLLAMGILPVAASGNEGYSTSTKGIGAPACVSGVISVGAVYDADYSGTFPFTEVPCTDFNPRRDQIVCFSSASPQLSILAPGFRITAANLQGSGTSMSTPHVSGAIAALASLRPSASMDQVRAALFTGAPSVYDPRLARSFPRLDMNTAVAALTAATGATPAETAAPFSAVAPARLLDSRDGTGGLSQKLSPGQFFDLTVAGVAGIPAGIKAVAINVTVTEPDAAGFLTVGAGGAAQPPVSNLNFTNQTVANSVVAPVSSDGKIRLFASATTHVIVDAQGWYGTGAESTFAAAPSPTRLLDTRTGGKPAAGQIVDLVIAGQGGVPANATAVVVNVTAVDAEASGYLTVFPAGAAPPLASNLNYATGATVPNLVVVKLGAGGAIRLLTTAPAHLLVDLAGWFGTSASSYSTAAPSRILDTRSGLGGVGHAIEAGGSIDVTVAGVAGVPTDAVAVIVNVTVTQTTGSGYLTVSPTGTAVPNASNLNYSADQSVPNLVVVKVGTGGKIRLTSSAATHAIIDVQGWYRL